MNNKRRLKLQRIANVQENIQRYSVRLMSCEEDGWTYKESKRYKAKRNILRFLIRKQYAFTFGRVKRKDNGKYWIEENPHYIVVFLKPEWVWGNGDKALINKNLNKRLIKKLIKKH